MAMRSPISDAVLVALGEALGDRQPLQVGGHVQAVEHAHVLDRRIAGEGEGAHAEGGAAPSSLAKSRSRRPTRAGGAST